MKEIPYFSYALLLANVFSLSDSFQYVTILLRRKNSCSGTKQSMFRNSPYQRNNLVLGSRYAIHPRLPLTSKLYGVSEWRDIIYETPTLLQNNQPREKDGHLHQEAPLREICILPFPLEDVLLQGETKELCLYEER